LGDALRETGCRDRTGRPTVASTVRRGHRRRVASSRSGSRGARQCSPCHPDGCPAGREHPLSFSPSGVSVKLRPVVRRFSRDDLTRQTRIPTLSSQMPLDDRRSPPHAMPLKRHGVRRTCRASARSPVALPLLPACARLVGRTRCTSPTHSCFAAFPGTSFPGVKAVTQPWTGCAPLEPGCFLEPSSPGDGVNVQEAGAPPSGAKQHGWKKHPSRLLA